ncbi:glutamate receptor 2.8 [Actinidia rufa]|uniref:Glutamate receptor 2.8 n=1 Tax=Actinidia rufa TaxID=165716 RepID=A0A7J0GBK8_9ERIC|nr:glutamate receptor 2.8 [Actinidia rufa]
MSNLTRFVVIIWCFVVLILTQSYTANLSSMLTVQKLQPTVTNINELIKKGEYVGYQKGTFVEQLLKDLNCSESKMKAYKSVEELNEFLTKGSENGGIAAAVDETPYIKLFLSTYCSNYTMVPLPFRTDGFGFVFPINFPLLHNISSAVLNVTQGQQIKDIEKKWFGETNCPDSSSLASHSLGLDSFWGLFVIAGTVSFSAVLVSIADFVYKQKDVLRGSGPRGTLSSKMVELAKRFDEKDLSFHAFKTSQVQEHQRHASSTSSL